MIPAAETGKGRSNRHSMADEEFEDDFQEFEAAEPQIDEDADDLDGELDEDLDPDALDDDALDDEGDAEVVVVDEEEEEDETPLVKKRRASEEDDEDDELIDPDDVEAALDTILKDRITAGDDDDEEDEEDTPEVETGGDPGDRVQPRRSDEFVCQSCFLVKHVRQRVGTDDICRDCV